MRKYYFAVTILTLIVLGGVFLGFTEGGSPFTQKLESLDARRLSDMNTLKYSIESYYQKNKKLPENLDQLTPKTTVTDPESKKPYDYKTAGDNSYQLCTNFSTDNTTSTPSSRDYLYQNNQTHKKGYQCISYSLSDYLIQAPTPYVSSEWRNLKSSILAEFDSYAASEEEPRIVIKENNQVKIVYLEGADIVNKSGIKVNIDTFITGDKVLIDTTMIKSTNNYRSSKIQNLTR